MEDYAAYLAKEALASNAILHEFRVLWRPDSGELHVFLEGDDDCIFYLPEVRRRVPGGDVQVYVCDGKPKLREVRELVAKIPDAYGSCVFFFDRDYDDCLGRQVPEDDRTYLTDGYSIENYVCTDTALQILLTDYMRLSRADPYFAAIEADMTKIEEVFVENMLCLAAWILSCKEAGVAVNLSNCNGLKGICEIGGQRIFAFRPDGFKRFKTQTGTKDYIPPVVRVKAWHKHLSTQDADSWIRGKFKFWFFHKALLHIIDKRNEQRVAAGGKKIRIPAVVREGRLFEALAGRVPPPATLTAFLNSSIGAPI